MEERDIWRTAQTMIGKYGEDTPIIAAQRVDALMALGDTDERLVWRRVKAAIEELLATGAPKGRTLN